MLMDQPPMMTADQSRWVLTKYRKLVLLSSSERTVQFNRHWRQVHGPSRLPSLPFIYEMLPTDIWSPFPVAQWWLFKRSCDSLALFSTSVVISVPVFLRQYVIGFTWTRMVHTTNVMLFIILSFLRPDSFRSHILGASDKYITELHVTRM